MIENNSNIAIINSNAFNKILEKGGFSEKAFLSWAARNELIEIDSEGKYKKQKRIKGVKVRCVFLVLEKKNFLIDRSYEDMYEQEETIFN